MLARTQICFYSLIILCSMCVIYGQETGVKFTNGPQPSQSSVLEGKPVELVCETSSPAHISWTLNGKLVTSTPRRKVVRSSQSSSKLIITRSDRVADGGAFGCVTTLASGDNVTSATTDLNIAWLDNPSVVLHSPSNIHGMKKIPELVLACEVDVYSPGVQYHWYRNNEYLPVSESSRFEVKNKKLHISQASAKDNGIYRCSVQWDDEISENNQNYVLAISDPTYPHISVHPDDVIDKPGATISFHCNFKDADVIEWYRGNKTTPVKNSERFEILGNNTLVIKRVESTDKGFYTCAGHGKHKKSHSQRYSSKLTVASLPSVLSKDFEPVISETRIVYALLGSPFRLTCLQPKDAFPKTQISWKALHPDKNYFFVSDSGEVRVEDNTLVIEKPEYKHQGEYVCVQENIAAVRNLSIYLIVTDTPEVVRNPSDVTVDENGPGTFECVIKPKNVLKPEQIWEAVVQFWEKILNQDYVKALATKHSRKRPEEPEFQHGLTTSGASLFEDEGVPVSDSQMSQEDILQKWKNDFNLDLFSVVWRKDGRLIKEDQNRVHMSKDETRHTLKLDKTFVSDKGQYWCEAILPEGGNVETKPATLAMIEKLKFSPPPVNKRLELYKSGKIHCKVQGTPPPQVVWYRGLNSPLPSEASSVNGTLQFTNVNKDHTGNYTCVAKNKQGTIQTTIHISVVVSPRFVLPSPSEIIDVQRGDSVWIDCVAVGDPEPKTQWDKNLTSIDSKELTTVMDDGTEVHRFKQFENGTLLIMNTRLEDNDRYGCTAGNSAGLKREEITLVVHPILFADEEGMLSKGVVITMSVVGAYILLVVGLVLWCKLRRKRKLADALETEKLEAGDLEMKDKEDHDKEHDKLIDNIHEGSDTENITNRKNKCNGVNGPKPKNGSIITNKSGSAANSGGDGSEVSRRSGQGGAYDKLVVSKDCLGSFVTLGRGEFGEVFTTKLEDDAVLPDEIQRTVMVKSLQQLAQRDESILAEFKRQLDTFSKLRHENVASVIGLCNQSQPHYMIFQYTDWGDLKQFLLATRTPEEVTAQLKGEPSRVETRAGCSPLKLVQQLAVAHHISRGMEAISDARVVHKDLATRNCLLTSKLSVKVSFVSLTKDVYSKEYCKHVNQVIPLRWLPFECVYESDYSTKSDVYMFACTVWEIFHKGELPFIKFNDMTILNHLKSNTLNWKAHPDMPEALVELLEKCWDLSPKNRPTFNDITKQLHKILTDAKKNSQLLEE